MTYERDQHHPDAETAPEKSVAASGMARFASLTAGLLARKGEAKPALEPFSHARVAPGSAREMSPGERHDLDRNENEFSAHGPAVRANRSDEIAAAPRWELPRTERAANPAMSAQHHQERRTGAALNRNTDGESRVHSDGDRAGPAPDGKCPRKAQAGRKAAVALRLTTHDYLRLRLAAAELEMSAHDIIIDAIDAYLDAQGVERFDECLCLQKAARACAEEAAPPRAPDETGRHSRDP